MADSARSHEHLSVGALAEFTDQWHFSHVVRARGLLFLSGVTGTDVEGHVDPDPARQFENQLDTRRVTVSILSIDRSKERISVTGVASAWATRYASAKSTRSIS